jgi:hypothetical protein
MQLKVMDSGKYIKLGDEIDENEENISNASSEKINFKQSKVAINIENTEATPNKGNLYGDDDSVGDIIPNGSD